MAGDQSDVRASYDRVAVAYAADLYDELDAKPADRALLAAFLELAGEGPIADLGCGPGQIAAYLARSGVVGVDLSPAMIAEARRRAPHVPFVVGSMTDLPVATGALAGAVAFYSVIHLGAAERRTAYREFARTVRPGGWLLLAFHVDDASVNTGGVKHLAEWFGARVSLDFHFLDPDVVAEDLVGAGFTVVSSTIRGPGEGEYPSRRCYLLARNSPDPAAPAVTSVRPPERRRTLRSRLLATLFALLLVIACCCGGCEWTTGLPSSELFVAARPDVDSKAVSTARRDGEQRIRRSLAVPAPPGATRVAEAVEAACYPGTHGLKINDEYDNVCLSRITVYYSLRGSSLAAALDAMHQHLLAAGWDVRRLPYAQRRGLLDPEVRVVGNGVVRSSGPAEYVTGSASGLDELAITFGPVDDAFLEQSATGQNITASFADPYWVDDQRIDPAVLAQKITDAGIAITAQREWFRNG